MESTRKLLEGERVEVRQKEKGLRGSWHSGVVVKVKSGRRVVEYDELDSKDGSRKLREMIRLREDNFVQFSAPRHSSNISAEHNTRGFIRPIPPPCPLSSIPTWEKGLLVDAFYDYAWWEGILVHDVFTKDEASKVNILFPEEGDELCCLIKDVRVSQEWDEESGQWEVRGSWSLCNDNGELDIDILRSICKQQNSWLKKLWRQRNGCVQASLTEKQKNFASISTSLLLESQGCQKTESVDNGEKSLPVVNGLTLPTENQDCQRVSPACDSMPSNCTASLKGQDREATGSLEEPGKEIEHLKAIVKCSASTNFLMEQSRSAAKKYLVKAGWKIEIRTRTQGISQGMKESVYTAPNGSKYYSLASACRGWKKLKNLPSNLDLPSTLEEGIRQRLKLLDAYNLAEHLMSTGKRLKKQVKAKAGQSDEKHKPKACEGGKPNSLPSSVVKSKIRKPAKGSGTQSVGLKLASPANDVGKSKLTLCTQKPKKRKCSEEGTEQKIKSTSWTEKLKKRKCTEEGTEQKCKKGRSSLRNEVSLQEGKASRGRGGCKMQVLLSSPRRQNDSSSAQIRTEPTHFKRSTVLSWLIDKGIIKDNEPVCYLSRKDGHVMKKGEVTREGVLCKCCKVVFTLSNFEAHAGSKLHRPSANIFLDDGRSISDCQLQACALEDAKEDNLADVSDDTCGVCADGGELILCDHCPSTFHPNCIGLEVIPDGDWYCPRCLCGGCGQNKMAGDEANAMSRCDQCELEYHPACVPESVLLKPMGVARGAWFCGRECEQIFTDLRSLVGKTNLLEGGFSWMLLRSMKNDAGLSPASFELMAEHNVKLGVAHDVMQECFIPMIDPRTKIDLISQALYNRKSKVFRLNYSGFYTIILEKGDEMISTATIRVHGCRLAEMPLVGTRYQYRRQGMCRRLMQALEQMLGNIGVKKLVLPAVPELLETWIGAFNFQNMTLSETHDLSRLNLMTFPGTTVLQKQLRKEPSAGGIPEKVTNHCSLTCESKRDPSVVAGTPLDGVVSDPYLSRESGQSDSYMVQKDIPLGRSVKTEGSHICTPSNLQSHQSTTQMTTEGQWLKISNSSCDISKDGKVKKDDDVQYARVVRATTRSKRLVKSSKWIADGLRELAKDIEESTCSLGTGENMQKVISGLAQGFNMSVGMLSQSNQERGNSLVTSTKNLATDSTVLNLDERDVSVQPCYVGNNLVDDSLSIFLAEAAFVCSPTHYVRRRSIKQQEEKEIDLTRHNSEVPPSTCVQSTVA